MNACAAGHGECVRVLLKAGADPLKDVLVPDARRDQKGLRTTDNAYLCAFHSGHREVEGIQARETAVGCRARLRQAPMSETVDEPSPQSRRGQPPCEIVQRERWGSTSPAPGGSIELWTEKGRKRAYRRVSSRASRRLSAKTHVYV